MKKSLLLEANKEITALDMTLKSCVSPKEGNFIRRHIYSYWKDMSHVEMEKQLEILLLHTLHFLKWHMRMSVKQRIYHYKRL